MMLGFGDRYLQGGYWTSSVEPVRVQCQGSKDLLLEQCRTLDFQFALITIGKICEDPFSCPSYTSLRRAKLS